AVDEVASSRGSPVDDGQILPSEGNDPGPRYRLPAGLPGAVLSPLQRAPDSTATLGPLEVTCQASGIPTPRRDLPQPGRPERASGEQDADGFQQVGLTLSVPSSEEIQPGRGAIREGAIVTKID